MAKAKPNARKRKWWTRERVILGLHRFYQDFGYCATSSETWAEKTQKPGRVGAAIGKYPSFATVLLYWPTFRVAWREAGYDVNRDFEAWTELEDWYILETVGILPRSEVSKDTGRTGPSIKRRLYDLGDIRSYNRWGITLSHAAALMTIGQTVLRKYMAWGEMPYLKGNKCYYLNPADLLKVQEYDWTRTDIPEELERHIRMSIAQRIAKILTYGADWRSHEPYIFQQTKKKIGSRYKLERRNQYPVTLPPVPGEFKVGDWVTTPAIPTKMKAGRKGVIKYMYWTPQRSSARPAGHQEPCWMARVEFPKGRLTTHKNIERWRATLPVAILTLTEAPKPDPPPLKMTKEAIRGRARFNERKEKTPVRFARVKDKIS